MKLVYSTLATAFLCYSISFGQSNLSLDGQIYDKIDGSAIHNATIEIVWLGLKTSSDDFGSFIFENIPPGMYSIKLTADGYDDTTLYKLEINADITRRIIINMSPKIYELGKITVQNNKTNRINITSDRVTIISRNEIRQSNLRELSEILETVEGVSIQKIGPSGESQIRIRGSNPGHVLVLIDGQKINPSGSGVADLSGIPVEIIERIELHKGGASTEFGPDALAGAVNIITRPAKLFENVSFGAQKGLGDWNTKTTELNISNPINLKNFSSRWSYLGKQSDGDFDFNYSVAGNNSNNPQYSGTRKNNFSKSDNIFASGIYKLSEKISFNYSGRYYKSNHGLPDRASRQNETAVMSDHRKLFTSAFNYKISGKHKFDIEFGYSQFYQHFLDIDTMQPLKYNSEFINDIITITHNQSCSFINGNLSRYSIMYRDETLNQTDRLRPFMSMGKTSRNNLSALLSVSQKADISKTNIFDILTVDAAVRFDISRTEKDSTSYADTVKTNSTKQLSPKFGIAISKGDKFSYILRASYGKSFRLPTLNALFWKGDVRSSGNPGLKPEKSEHSEAGAELKFDFGDISVSGGMTYFHSFIKDLVVWSANAQGVWRPSNLALSQTTGHEDFIHLNLLNNKIRISYQNTIATALNKTQGHNSYGKRITFSPHYITTLSARINISALSFSYSIRMVDSAFIKTANTKSYESYRLDDIRFGFNYGLLNNWQLSASAKIENIFDTNYVLMTHYPMPGRQWNIFVGLYYNLRKENK